MIPNHHKRKHGSNMAKKTVAQTWPKNQKLNVEDHIASMPTEHGRKPIPVLAPDNPLPTPASQQILYLYVTGCEIKPTHIDMWLYEITHQARGTTNRSLYDRGEYLPQESSPGIPAMVNYLHSLPPVAPCRGLVSELAILSSIIIPKSIHNVELIKYNITIYLNPTIFISQ